MSSELMWLLSRSSGITSLVLLTLVATLGVWTSGRRRPHSDRATVITVMHRWLALGSVVFAVAHIVTAIADNYVPIGWLATVVPFASGWSPLWIGLGTLALDLLIAVMITSAVRHRIAERAWKLVHWTAYLLWPLAVIHGFALALEDPVVMPIITAACGLVLAVGILFRLAWSHHDRDRRRDILVQEWA